MTAAIMQPYMFPYIGYFQLMKAADVFVILDDVQAANNKWINSNFIFDGRFMLPIQKYSQHKEIRQLELVDGIMNHFFDKRLNFIYGKQPFYNQAKRLLDHRPVSNISIYVYNVLVAVAREFDLSCEVMPSSSVFPRNGLTGQDRIIDICHQLGADEYVNPEGGVALYDRSRFEAEGMKLKFLRCLCENKLSIVDVLMTNSIYHIQNELMGQYEFITE